MSGTQPADIRRTALGVDSVAPTPQNTPLNPASNELSRPHVPATVVEDEEDAEVISSAAARGNPNAFLNSAIQSGAFAGMVQNRLAGLVGRSSGYVERLPAGVRSRVDGLQAIQESQTEIESRYQKELLALDKKFAKEYAPVFERRARIVQGLEEPTEDEVKEGIKIDEEDEDEDEDDEDEVGAPAEKVPRTPATREEIQAAPKGIPEFWLTALKNHLGISELITERDEEALKHLVDVRYEYLEGEKSGFTLVFEFSEEAKEFFENGKLVKTYYYDDKIGRNGDLVYERAEGTKIDWKDGKNLTVKIETKKQRNKNTKQTRIVKSQVPTDSFFNFFSPPVPPTGEEEDLPEDIEEQLEIDYQIGEDIKEKIIPRAVDFFTGKALRYENVDDFDEDDFEDEDFDEDEDDDDEDGRLRVQGGSSSRPASQPPLGVTPASAQEPQECKQQ